MPAPSHAVPVTGAAPAPSGALVVEVEGGYHAARERADGRRDRQLGALGWRVVRVPAELVMGNLEAAVAVVR